MLQVVLEHFLDTLPVPQCLGLRPGQPIQERWPTFFVAALRVNGGQYTHGAIWTAMAFALMGDSERAWELFALLNPIHHGGTAKQIATYKVEPYVVAADVYAVIPHVGRGGWTWYTGSAGWMYRLLIETLLGVNLEGDQLRLTPRLPKTWTTYKVHYRYRATVYHHHHHPTRPGLGRHKFALPRWTRNIRRDDTPPGRSTGARCGNENSTDRSINSERRTPCG